MIVVPRIKYRIPFQRLAVEYSVDSARLVDCPDHGVCLVGTIPPEWEATGLQSYAMDLLTDSEVRYPIGIDRLGRLICACRSRAGYRYHEDVFNVAIDMKTGERTGYRGKTTGEGECVSPDGHLFEVDAGYPKYFTEFNEDGRPIRGTAAPDSMAEFERPPSGEAFWDEAVGGFDVAVNERYLVVYATDRIHCYSRQGKFVCSLGPVLEGFGHRHDMSHPPYPGRRPTITGGSVYIDARDRIWIAHLEAWAFTTTGTPICATLEENWLEVGTIDGFFAVDRNGLVWVQRRDEIRGIEFPGIE